MMTAAATGNRANSPGNTNRIRRRRKTPSPCSRSRFHLLSYSPVSRSPSPFLPIAAQEIGKGLRPAGPVHARQGGGALGDQVAVPPHLVAVIDPHRGGPLDEGADGEQVIVMSRL